VTLRRKLLLWYTGVLAVTSFVAMVALYLFSAHQMRREIDKFLLDELKETARHCRVSDLAALRTFLRIETEAQLYFPMVFRLYDPAAGKDDIVIARKDWRDELPPLSDAASRAGPPSP